MNLKENIMRVIATILFAFVGIFTHAQTVESIMVDGLERSYRLLVPENYDPTKPIPLVFNFHGLGSNAFQQQLYSNMNGTAEANNFMVVYPEGVDNAFNAGGELDTGIDDVAFTSAMIDTLAAQYNINLRRIYSCGMSNGGFMSYRLACELGDRIAAIASITGGMIPTFTPTCDPERPVPIMQVHGTADDVVFFEGRPFVNDPIDTTVAFWASINRCSSIGDTMIVDDIDPSDSTTAIRIDFADCADGSGVVYYVIDGGGHTWPGALIAIGVTNQDFDATTEIWNFFEQYELPELLVNTNEVSENSIRIFPNPTNDYIQIESVQFVQSYQVVDVNGRIILQGENLNGIGVDKLLPGMYTLVLHGISNSFKEKFIKL